MQRWSKLALGHDYRAYMIKRNYKKYENEDSCAKFLGDIMDDFVN